MNVFGRVAKGVFGKGTQGFDDEQDDSEVESLLHQISDARHAGDRRDAMSQLRDLLQDNPRAQLAMGAMGLPVVLAVLQEDRDDLELLKGALEVLQLTLALPESASAAGNRGGAAAHQQLLLQQQQLEQSPPPALINADLLCRAPDNVLLLLGLLRPEPEGVDDFYVRYSAMQAMSALLAACPDKLQACVLSSPLGVVALSDLLASPMEVLRNEALLLLVGLCSGCPQIASIAAFEGAFERLLSICGSEGGPGGGDVVVQDAAELMNNLLRDNLANQRLFREMGHIDQLPQLLHFTPPPAPAAAAAAGMLGSAGQLGAAAGAAAAAAAGTAVGAAAAAAVAAAGAAASGWPQQVAANYLCVLETARLLLAGPHSVNEDQRAQEDASRRANQDRLGQRGLLPLLAKLGADGGGAPSAAVRAQALFCLGDLVHGHAQLQEQLAGVLVQPAPAHAPQPVQPQQQQQQRLGGFLPPLGPPTAGQRGAQGKQQHPLPLLQVALQLILRSNGDIERAGASHLMHSFCHANSLGQTAVLSTVAVSLEPCTFGEELCAALLCQPPAAAAAFPPLPAAAAAAAPFTPPGSAPQDVPSPAGAASPRGTPASSAAAMPGQPDLQLQAGRAARVVGFLLHHNPAGQHRLLALQVGEAQGDTLLGRCVRLLSECAQRGDGVGRLVCCSVLRMLTEWCVGCQPAVAALLSPPGHLPLLVDLAGGRVPGGDGNTAGLAAVLLGICLMFAPGSPISQQQQQQQQANGSAPPPPQFATAPPGAGPSFSQLLDVLISRVGLSQFFGALDGMQADSAYQTAKATPRLPAHISRTSAAAVLDAEGSGGAGSAAGAWGLLSGALSAAAGTGDAAAAAGQDLQLYDHAFTQLVSEVAEAVQRLTLDAFSGAPAAAGAPPPWQPAGGNMPQPAASAPAASGAAPGALAAAAAPAAAPAAVASGPPPPWQPPGAPPSAAAAAAAAAAGLPTPASPAAVVPPAAAAAAANGPLAALAAQLQGSTADEKLGSALHLILQLQGSCAELQSRNRALAEDLIRLSQSKPQQLAAAEAADAAADGAAAANGSGVPAANGVLGGGSGPKSSAADAESRVAAQLRASRAEMEAGAMRQQLAAMQERWSGMEAAVAAAREEAEAAAAAAAKAEADLGALSTAYNGLEQHAFDMEEQLRQLQQQQQGAAAAAGAAGGLRGADVQARTQAAAGEDREQRPPAETPLHAAAAGDGDLEASIAAAAAEARAAAEAEAEEEMEDLLACLGEEQAKVEVLSSRLEELGEDVDKLLEAVAAAVDDEEELEGAAQPEQEDVGLL
ncbi:hypothetical protein COO60DRAFT_308594 [Scenedesmus sp. NREL 46B-D3]|nr:hypothetical protein COO60DRAFT_308594 [Scenedesmus sp. NREL 46B-D3]